MNTAAIAKSRLQWCVKARREGGFWNPQYEKFEYYVVGKLEPVALGEGRLKSFRWVHHR